MKVTFLLAEGAAPHADQTVSILKAGLNQVGGPELPVEFRVAVVVLFEAEPNDVGAHSFDIRCIDARGTDLLRPISESFTIKALPASGQFVKPVKTRFSKVGEVAWVLRVDETERGNCTMNVAIRKPLEPRP
jgi:hypothetical protein